jgi:hypothetical protein
MISKNKQSKSLPKVNKKRLINDPSPRISNSNLIEELENEKRRRYESDEDNEAVEEDTIAELEEENQDDQEECPRTNSFSSNSTSFASIASPVLSYPKLANIPESTNRSVASSITRSDTSNDSTIMLDDHIDVKHLEIGLSHLFYSLFLLIYLFQVKSPFPSLEI